MKINDYLIQLSITIIIIFGGTFVIKYFRTGDILIPQGIAFAIGLILIISSFIWRYSHKRKTRSQSPS
ncbi:hypothetical protein CN918_28205 [Priestia megaterium]|nr:hypothetical protein CN918_28205 [Priestia megaterium]